MMVTKRAQLLEEWKLGLWDKEEFRAKVADMERKCAGDGSPSVKRQKTQEYSPDWDLRDFDKSSSSIEDL